MTFATAVTPDYVIGDTWDLSAAIRNEAGTGPFDLTGCTVLFTLKRKTDVLLDDSAALAKLSWVSGGSPSPVGIAVAAPASGVAAITVPSSVTALLSSAFRYRYDLRIVNPAGEVRTCVIVEFSPVLGVTERTVP